MVNKTQLIGKIDLWDQIGEATTISNTKHWFIGGGEILTNVMEGDNSISKLCARIQPNGPKPQ